LHEVAARKIDRFWQVHRGRMSLGSLFEAIFLFLKSMLKKRYVAWGILIFTGLFIKIFSLFPSAVEHYYTNGIYPCIGLAQRWLLGWIPFSIGDLLYAFVTILLVRKCIRFFRKIRNKQADRPGIGRSVEWILFNALVVYVMFNLLWGLNYNRLPMGTQLGMTPKSYSTEELNKVFPVLIDKLNGFDSAGKMQRAELERKRTLFQKAIDAYGAASASYPFPRYRYASIKPSIFSYAGNYLGFTGYYNPFTGEAQTNTTVPLFVQPFTTCHEIGHQLGYAKENEANFAGFLAARHSVDPSLQYSLYFEMYSYAIYELRVRDSVKADFFFSQLKPDVQEDFLTMRQFFQNYKNPVEPVIRKLYEQYLMANEQPKGLQSYNEVVAMMLAYYRKFGEI
jgi:hypothetical protein